MLGWVSAVQIKKIILLRTHSAGLSHTAIDTHGHLLFSNNFIGCQLNFAVFSKLPLWFISFSLVIQSILVLFCLHCERYGIKYKCSEEKVPEGSKDKETFRSQFCF